MRCLLLYLSAVHPMTQDGPSAPARLLASFRMMDIGRCSKGRLPVRKFSLLFYFSLHITKMLAMTCGTTQF